MPKKISESQVEKAIGQLDSVRREWLRRPGVTGVDVGYKIRGDKLTDELAVRVHVERKLPPEALPAYETFTVSGKGEKLGPFPVDVVEAAYGPSQTPAAVAIEELEDVNRRGRVDPLVGGVSVGNPRITAGTLATIVWDRVDCSINLLSNWHVLVGSPAASAGEPIYQPGRLDGGTAADTVATLNRFRLDADMDAAIARLNGLRGSTRDIIGLTPLAGIENPVLGMNVVKSGRTTGVTRGVIDGVSFSGTINYDHGPNTFHNQIHIVPRPPWPGTDYEVSRGGDSGSVWINEATGKAVGLHYGGEVDPAPTSEMALANPMTRVAARTGLNFSVTPLFFCGVLKPPPRDVIKPVSDIPPKSLVSDLPSKAIIDPIKLPAFDVGTPVSPGVPVTGPVGPLLGGGGPAPFVFATPHHFGAPGGGEIQAGYQAALAEADALLEQLAALRQRLATALGTAGERAQQGW
ncbi:MAG: S1 family peptidase [Actinomycetota bacterium]|nr:S1 family peptidase [Actinomycetota bacterium]